ncbi:hypothetical protein FA95DRAFT_518579 [Auriscalpium vulgare]|uniref:Uncharacterized protein n=1 Tax=Auriscalpium vulgare TaxID=40419 RepID=A0ACB8S3T0_9AGAM|nr:hypothetical protein FA95DRAFT_518579 [Auriscalpium vulgare]
MPCKPGVGQKVAPVDGEGLVVDRGLRVVDIDSRVQVRDNDDGPCDDLVLARLDDVAALGQRRRGEQCGVGDHALPPRSPAHRLAQREQHDVLLRRPARQIESEQVPAKIGSRVTGKLTAHFKATPLGGRDGRLVSLIKKGVDRDGLETDGARVAMEDIESERDGIRVPMIRVPSHPPPSRLVLNVGVSGHATGDEIGGIRTTSHAELRSLALLRRAGNFGKRWHKKRSRSIAQ